MKNSKLILCSMILLLSAAIGGCGTADSTTATTAHVQTETSAGEEESLQIETEAKAEGENEAAALEDGIYLADFDTDSSMFHVNEASEGKGTLTVENGEMTIHISLVSKNIVGLYLGLAADAPDDEDNWIPYTEDEITYKDGWTETVYGFDIPVAALDEEFDLALIGKKGNWYDHKVSVSNPEPVEE